MSKYISHALLISSALVGASAYAEDPLTGPYIGAGAGQAQYKDACADIPGIAGSLGVSSSCDERNTAFKIFGGYRFLPNLAAEIAYTNPGKAKATIGAANVELKSWLIPIHAVGILPLFDDQLWLIGKVGGVYWHGKLDASGPGGSLSNSDNGFAFTYGAGLQYNFTPNLGVRGEYEIFHDVGDENTVGKGDIRMWSLSIVYKF
jgi:OmpA-OmpF porin, OOP family